MHRLLIRVTFASCALALVGVASAQIVAHRPQSPASGTWQRAANTPPAAVGVPLLLTDGTIMCHGPLTNQWYKLTPSSTGSYQNGTWTTLASMQSDYGPLYYASSVLADGRVVVIGGEYNLNQGGVWTNKGAYYNPVTDKWAVLPAPAGWSGVGDAQCQVLPDGRFLLANLFDRRIAALNPATMTWTALNGTGKMDRQDEEGWVLLKDGTILTCDAEVAPHAEKYIISQDKWVSASDTPQSLCDAGSLELGPMVLMPDGKVFAFGATGHNAIYTPGANPTDPGSWTAAPDFPNIGGQLDIADGPAVLLPNGKILAYASPGVFNSPSHFYEWDGTALLEVANLPHSSGNPSYVGNFLILPNGQVMFTDLSNDVEFYTPTGAPNDAWRPKITSVASNLILGKTFLVKGTQFNGLSNGSAYGDDSTNNSNYPLARVTYTKTGKVAYFRTHDHSTMGVATGSTVVSTNIDVPKNADLGPAKLQIVTNGIASAAVDVTITKDALKPEAIGMYEGRSSTGSVTSVFESDNSYFQVNSITQSGYGEVASAFTTFTTTGTGSFIQMDFESSVTQSVQVIYFLFNWTTNAYEQIGNASQTTTDKNTSFTVNNAAKYISNTGKVKALFRAVNPNRSNRSALPMSLKIDKVALTAG